MRKLTFRRFPVQIKSSEITLTVQEMVSDGFQMGFRWVSGGFHASEMVSSVFQYISADFLRTKLTQTMLMQLKPKILIEKQLEPVFRSLNLAWNAKKLKKHRNIDKCQLTRLEKQIKHFFDALEHKFRL